MLIQNNNSVVIIEHNLDIIKCADHVIDLGPEAGEKGGRRGDLYLLIYVRPHEIFERQDSDIYCEVPIGFVTAVFGGEVEIPTLGGKAKMKIPAGTQSGRMFRLKGKGIAHLSDGGIGDDMVKVQV